MSYNSIRQVVCATLLMQPDPGNWSEPNVRDEIYYVLHRCSWYEVYDVAEGLVGHLGEDAGCRFSARLNQFFCERGIGWEMRNGRVLSRGVAGLLAGASEHGVMALTDSGRPTAAQQLREALLDMSRRPKADLTGAVHHAIAALEATARDVTGEPNLTLGRLVPKLQLSPPLDTAVSKLWGFASNRARHVREGEAISRGEAELVVIIAAGLSSFVAQREAGEP